MTQPTPPGTPPVALPSIPVAARAGNVYLTSPVTGETKEVDPTSAVEMIQGGWVPMQEPGAEALRTAQIPGEVAAQQPALGKFGYGVARGVLTPAVDFAYPAGSRIHEVLAEDSPWLVGGGEAAGIVGSALLGGPARLLEEGAAVTAAKLGTENALVRAAFRGGLEMGAYGTMEAVSKSHDENMPLTAQRFASEVIPGMIFGSVLGGGLGALGGLGKYGTLPERIHAADAGKLDAIFRAGVSDEDALRLGRELGVKDPTMLQRLQAEANGAVSAERRALLADSGEVGKRARADAYMSGERLAEAQRRVVDLGNDYLLGREEAMKQVVGETKAAHIADMVGPGQAAPEDIQKLIRDQVVDSGDWAANSARRAEFVDHALEALDPGTTAELERTLGTSGNLRERLLTGLTEGQNETIDALGAALGKRGLNDAELRSFGLQGSWSLKPLDVLQKWRTNLEGLAALPRGVNDNVSDIGKLLGNIDLAEQSVLRDPRAIAAHQLDSLKKRVADFADAGERLGAGSGVPATARAMYEDLRVMLEDPTVWGPKFSGFQQRVNQLLHQNIGMSGEFDNLFTKTIGKPDPENPWRMAKVVDSEKVQKALEDMSEPQKLEQLQRIRDHLDDQKKFFQEQLGLKLGPKSRVRIQAGIKQIDQLRESVDNAVYLHTAQRQGRAMMGFGPLSPALGRAAVGYVIGGPVGALAGAGLSAALNPGKMLQVRAIAERMADATGSRVWRGISNLLGLRVGDVARETAGIVGRSAERATRGGKVGAVVQAMLNERGDERARTYSQTVKQLTEARAHLPELAQRLDSTMPLLEQALPGTKQEMLAQAQRGIEYVLSHLPAQPKMRLYGETTPPISDQEYEGFVRQTFAALDPPSILEMANNGELTPQAVAAAEFTAPQFVQYIRSEMVRAIGDVGVERIKYDNLISASLLMGTPLDESLEPENIAIQQATHKKRKEMMQEAMKQMQGQGQSGGGETGLNHRYMSETERLEDGTPPR